MAIGCGTRGVVTGRMGFVGVQMVWVWCAVLFVAPRGDNAHWVVTWGALQIASCRHVRGSSGARVFGRPIWASIC